MHRWKTLTTWDNSGQSLPKVALGREEESQRRPATEDKKMQTALSNWQSQTTEVKTIWLIMINNFAHSIFFIHEHLLPLTGGGTEDKTAFLTRIKNLKQFSS